VGCAFPPPCSGLTSYRVRTASQAFDLASSVFAADQESSAADASDCTGTESLIAVSVALLARAAAAAVTPSKGQVPCTSPQASACC